MIVCNAIVVSVNVQELKVALETRTCSPREIAECILVPFYGPVRLYIWKMHPDGSSRCFIQMLHLGVVRFFISSMHPDESSECNHVRLLFIF